VRTADSDSNKSGGSQSSHLSLEESPPYSRHKSTGSPTEFIYKPSLAMAESPYEAKSVRSECSRRSERPLSPASPEPQPNGNPFESVEEEEEED